MTGGGLPLEEVDCATLESRLRPGLFVCGELIDLTGRIGGFNFYIVRPIPYNRPRARAQSCLQQRCLFSPLLHCHSCCCLLPCGSTRQTCTCAQCWLLGAGSALVAAVTRDWTCARPMQAWLSGRLAGLSAARA